MLRARTALAASHSPPISMTAW
jgi:hypothetical protein